MMNSDLVAGRILGIANDFVASSSSEFDQT